MDTLYIVFMIILAYLLGSIPWALIIGKVFYKTDIRELGSGNLGGTNAGRNLGKKAGISVILLDISKCFFATFLGSTISIEVGALCGLACVLGHCYPVFAGFRGGKGVASAFGFAISTVFFCNVSWIIIVIALISILSILWITKMVSVATLSTLLIVAISLLFLSDNLTIKIVMFLLFVFITFKHRANIRRIIKGTERKITWI